MRLVNPQDTLGWWRVGSETEMYGRYARGFADASNPNAFFQLALDRGLWGGLPLDGSTRKRIAARVLFFDQGHGSFEVHYDGLGGNAPTLIQVKKTDTKTWKEACAVVTDGRFGGRGPGGSDVWIRNADSEDDIIGGLEIADASLDDIALKGCDFGWDRTKYVKSDDILALLERDVVGKVSPFLAGRRGSFYLGGQSLAQNSPLTSLWNVRENETLGFMHPWFRDGRARGIAIVCDEITGCGHDLHGWEFYRDTRVLNGSVTVAGKVYTNPSPSTLLWRPDRLTVRYEIEPAVVLEEVKFFTNDDARNGLPGGGC